ncbi:MAG: DUF433 domain-containing protein [Merismopediaceae bacterium]|nr:DUF433 domain-containing protein [Merismopediaceae bacterium]
MQLENYVEFLAEDDIRLKGHRIGIEDILKYYLKGYSPEEILSELPSLNLEKIIETSKNSEIRREFNETIKITS